MTALDRSRNRPLVSGSSRIGLIGTLCLASCTATIDGPGTSQSGPPVLGAANGAGGTASPGPAVPATDPGRVTLHRLNRAEYNNTVRDLLGTTSRPADAFPPDDRTDGFDNMADTLTVSPLHLSNYHSAVKAVVTEALANPTQRAALLTCDLAAQGDTCASETLKGFAHRAWRRPATEVEANRLLGVVTAARGRSETTEHGLALALRVVLLSPYFNFRVEIDPDPTSLTPHQLSGYELATRLSYFLWSSTPDTTLLASAASGALADPAKLSEQLARLLTDERSSALIDNFAGQWLRLRAINPTEAAPDPTAFPSFDAPLLAAMKAEGELLFKDVAVHGAPVTTLLTANYAYLNDRLATHYGLPAVGSTTPVKVDLASNAQRGGFLGQGGFLTISSLPLRTSPVRRGKWVLEELLCLGVPPAPEGIDLGALDKPRPTGTTQRQMLEQHRQDPKCISCHEVMDPIGFGLESYDAVGAYRTMDGGGPVDASGGLPNADGVEAFSGAKQLGQLIAARPQFAHCVTHKLYTYALGRPPSLATGHMDTQTLDGIAQAFVASGYSWRELLTRIVQGPTFTNRRGEPGVMP